MKAFHPFWLAPLTALHLWACTEPDEAPLFVQTEYQLRCLDCRPAAPDDEARVLNAVDGENGLSIRCNANLVQGNRQLSFGVSYGERRSSDRFELAILRYDLDGEDPGRDCLITVAEGANTYEGECTDDEPDEDAPCQVQLEEEAGIVRGTLRCERIRNRSSDSARYLVNPRDPDDPIELEIHGCTGLDGSN